MANITLSRASHDDYRASMFFRSLNVADAKFTTVVRELKTETATERVPLVHVEGVQVSTGLLVNFDIWPRNHATAEDLAKFPKAISDFAFRIGYAEVLDEDGNKNTVASKPKFLGYYDQNGNLITLSGEKRVYGEDPLDNCE